MSAVRNKGIFRWFFFLWLFIHRANASKCFCTPGDSSTPVHSRPHSASETVGFMESKTCFNGIFQTGMEWIRVDKTEIFIRKHSLTACPDGLVQITSGIHHTRNGFETLKTEKTTNSRLRREERRFLLDSVNHAQCDFEVKSFCSWRNIQGGHDDFDWVLYQSSTPTDDTGPTFDHTLNNATGSYIFIESSAPRSTLDTAWIQSPEIDATVVPVHCFRFWYHMFGSSIGRLNIYQVTHGILPGNLVWSLTGAQGSTWMKGQVPLSSNRNYSVLISGIVGNGYQGDIAIDDVSVSPGYCDVKPSIASRTNVTNTVDGVWNTWAAWSICNVTCGGGTKHRMRDCYFPSSAQPGLFCIGELAEKTTCNENLCPVDGVLEEWMAWTTCSKTCGGGSQTRLRDCTFPGLGPFGKPCNGHTNESQPCNPQSLLILFNNYNNCHNNHNNHTPINDYHSINYNPHHHHDYHNASSNNNSTYNSIYHDASTNFTSANCTINARVNNNNNQSIIFYHFCNSCCYNYTNNNIYCFTNNYNNLRNYYSTNVCGKCHVCRGTPQICEQLYVLQECPADKQFCINELTNKEDASRTVNRRCGTQDECDNGWHQTYSADGKCIGFDENLVYTTDFYCEYCCNEDGCNKLVHPPITWTP
ncbi:hypothetical protein DPMN_005674 [Dreissena polymorpha]|uniref:MAM domain-containing protein n=1 Tax=Dreissena polymorpha TaxID=45954 RepID=A0A9D4RX31_DREPO|nr:hypothetical protein DPMN_005674 [Dreissena polymorpha]